MSNEHRVDALQPQQFTIHGTVTRSDGTPLAGATVRAVDWDRVGEDPLGEATTQSNGRYEISYIADQGIYTVTYDSGDKSTNFEVHIADTQGKEIRLSDTKFKVDKHEVLNPVTPTSVRPLIAEYQRPTTDLEKQ